MKTIKKNFKFLMLLMAMASLTVACDGEDGIDGAVGPQGPAGAQGTAGMDGMDGADGADGTNGEDGTDGEDGADGNANVIASDWIAADFPPFSFSQSAFVVEDDAITQEVLNSATVLAYFSFESITDGPIGQAFALPFTEPLFRSVFFEYSISVGEIRYTQFDDSDLDVVFDGSVRYVIIPPAATSGTAREADPISIMLQQGVDVDDYYQVMDYLGLDY